ncbi:unnamed protein product, partial [Mesorhabditis spiculigera]
MRHNQVVYRYKPKPLEKVVWKQVERRTADGYLISVSSQESVQVADYDKFYACPVSESGNGYAAKKADRSGNPNHTLEAERIGLATAYNEYRKMHLVVACFE